MSQIIASPMNRISIRKYAMQIRALLGIGSADFISAPKLFDERGLTFDYQVLSDDNPIFVNKEEAFTDTDSGIIYVKESVMEQACRRKYRRGAFTLIYELGHYLLHYLQDDVKLARVSDDISVPIYRNPEWQADTFASEFLMPFDECIHMNVEDIRKRYHVSRQAAEVRFNKIQDEINKR